MTRTLTFSALAGIGMVCLLVGCSESKTVPPPVSGVVTTLSPETLAVLAKADAYDGTVDKVVKKCFACNLSMDGKSDLFTKVGGYEVHFCDPEQKKTFDADPQKAILAAKLPEPAKK